MSMSAPTPDFRLTSDERPPVAAHTHCALAPGSASGRFRRDGIGFVMLLISLPWLMLGLFLSCKDWDETLEQWHQRCFGYPLIDPPNIEGQRTARTDVRTNP